MDKSGIFVGAIVGSISIFIIFSALFIIPTESDETTLEIQNQIDEINELILTNSESKILSLTDIFEKAEPGVVRVNTIRNQTMNETGGVGSGFVFDKMGHIITNAHVVEGSTKTIVTFLDGRSEFLSSGAAAKFISDAGDSFEFVFGFGARIVKRYNN